MYKLQDMTSAKEKNKLAKGDIKCQGWRLKLRNGLKKPEESKRVMRLRWGRGEDILDGERPVQRPWLGGCAVPLSDDRAHRGGRVTWWT